MNKIDALFKAKLWQWLVGAGLVIFIIGGADVSFINVHDDYRSVFLLFGVVLVVVGAFFGWYRAKKMGGK